MIDWKKDKRWSDKFLPRLKRICGEFLIGEAPYEDDAQRNTDLIVLKLDAIRIACRVRKHVYLDRYGSEFTIRAGRPNGTKTELAKIIEGWGDYLLYAFADESESELAAWTLCNLSVFRLWLNRHIAANGGRLPGTEKPNIDGSSVFRSFRYDDLPYGFVKAKGGADAW